MKREQEISEIESDSVRSLLSGLKRVEAPGDFDFRVKARLAQGRPASRNVSLMPAWLKVAVPLVLVLFIGGYFGFRSIYSPVVNVEPVAQLASEPPINITSVNEEQSRQESELRADGTVSPRMEVTPPVVDDKIFAAANKNSMPDRLVSPIVRAEKRNGGGSLDFGQREGRVKSLKKPKDIASQGGLAAQDMLTQMGIDASYSGSWKVGNVKQNSIGERSGVKSGDVIEAINDQNLAEKTTLASPFSGKSIRVRRDGKSVQIELKP